MRPYGDNAERYWEAGWRGVLPLPYLRKDPPPYGYTGANGQWPSFADVYAWAEGPEGKGNIGLRFPSNVLGVDVDGYSGKVGRQTLERAIEKWGKLPETWISSSRDDGVSGIYLFRVPDDLRWPGEVGPGIELIQRRHRYMVAPPSIHPSGRAYRWMNQYWLTDEIPCIGDLPFLPDAWVHGLTLGELAQDVSKVWVTNEQVAAWIGAAPSGPLCRDVKAAVVAITGKLREARHSRHETATRGVMRLVHLGSEGHHGVSDALGIVHGVFLAVATLGAGARSPEAAGAEWERIVYGAVGVVMADGFDADDPCTSPLGVRIGGHDSSPPNSLQVDQIRKPGTVTINGNGAHVPNSAGTIHEQVANLPIVETDTAHDATIGQARETHIGHDSLTHHRGLDDSDTTRGALGASDDEYTDPRRILNIEGFASAHDAVEPGQSLNGHGLILSDGGALAPTARTAESDEGANLGNVTLDGNSLRSDEEPLTVGTGNLGVETHTQSIADPELAFMVEQQLLRQRANEMAREILAREKAHATFRVPPSLPTLADELALPDEEIQWTISEVLPHGTNVLLTAQYKTGKTTLVNHLGKTLADGVDFLARFLVHTPAVNVALWNYEVSAGMYRRWLRDVLIKNTDRISVANLRGYSIPLLVPTVQDFAVEWLKSRAVHTWIVDPAARAMPGLDENSNVEVGQFLDTLDIIKERAGVANLILVTHTGRAEMAQGRERARGATRFDDWADVRWLLTKDDDGFRYFRATGRDVDTDEFRLMFDPLTRSLTASDDEKPAPTRGRPSKVTDGEIADTITRLVRELPGQSKRALEENIRIMLKCRINRVHDMMKALESQGVIVPLEGARGAQHIYTPDAARVLSIGKRPLSKSGDFDTRP